MAASSPAAAALPQWVHFTMEPVFAGSPPQRDAAIPSALATAAWVTWPAWILSPARRCGSSLSARRQPLSASASTKGKVALLRAKVEVRATPPGMLATQ